MTVAPLVCGCCGVALRVNAKFCDECGTPTRPASAAEYKQVTVLFADVVGSMDMAAAVGPERLREIMASWSTVRQMWFSATAARWTSSPVTGSWRCSARRSRFEDHAVRACLAALGVQDETKRLALEVRDRDGVDC